MAVAGGMAAARRKLIDLLARQQAQKIQILLRIACYVRTNNATLQEVIPVVAKKTR
jgi:hypothetical protein